MALIKTWTALAEQLGIARKTVWLLRDRHGGPAEMDLDAWTEFLEHRAEEALHHLNEENASDDVKKLRMKLLNAQAGKEDAIRKLRELELEQKQKGLVPIEDARDAIRKVLHPLRELIEGVPKAAAVQANPADPLMAEEAIRYALDKILQLVQKEVRKKPKKAPTKKKAAKKKKAKT